MNKNLLFYNKEGYLYNFEFNENEEYYEGKIFFDENSSDTFKTLGMYIFEDVKPIDFIQDVKINKIELYNESGMTFKPSTYSGSTITNITNVNSDSEFYSKWVFGDKLDKLYPKGTIVSFDTINFIDKFGTPVTLSDFNEKYYTVLENKPNAILVNTVTNNSLWTYTYVTGGTINSHNIIKFNDYDNTLIPMVEGYTFHTDKKLNVIDSNSNTGIKTYVDSGLTNTYYDVYDSSSLSVGDKLKLEVELFTERPKIYQGEVFFNISGTTATLDFTRGFNSFFNIEEGQSFIFEDYNDNPILPTNPVFTVRDGAGEYDLYDGEVDFIHQVNVTKSLLSIFNKKSLSAKVFSQNYRFMQYSGEDEGYIRLLSGIYSNLAEYDNYLEIKSEPLYTLNVGEVIHLSGTSISGATKNENRKYTIEKYLSFRDIRIEYWQSMITQNAGWLTRVQAKSVTNGISLEEQVLLEAISMYDTQDNNIKSSDYIPSNQRYYRIKVKEYVINEDTTNEYNIKRLISLEESNTLVCDILTPVYTAMTMNVIAYDTTNILTFEQTVLEGADTNPDIESTINALNINYESILDKYGLYMFYDGDIKILSKWSTNINEDYLSINLYDNNVEMTGNTISEVNTLYLEVNEDLVSEEYLLNDTDNFVKNYHAEIQFDLQYNNTDLGFVLMVSDNEYYIKFVDDTQTTIESFISTYSSVFDNQGVTLSLSGTNILVLDGELPNVYLYSLNAKVNSFSSYEILSEELGDGIFIVGNEIELPEGLGYDFYDYGLSTGMIMNITSDEESLSLINKEYNIIGLTPTIIELSYQGAMPPNSVDFYKFTNSHFLVSYEDYQLLSINDTIYMNVVGLYSGYDTISNLTVYPTGEYISGEEVIEYQVTTTNTSSNVVTITNSGILELIGTTHRLTFNTRPFLRKPRESYDKDVYYSFRWEFPEDEDEIFRTHDIFMYDFSGEHLKPYEDDDRLRYVGTKPLWDPTDPCSLQNEQIYLRDEANKNLDWVNDPTKQQTVFRGENGEYMLEFVLDQFDASNEYDYTPEPLQTFIGFNSTEEGVSKATLLMDKVENIVFSGYTNSDDYPTNIHFNFSTDGELQISTNQPNFNFNNYGFEKNQDIDINFDDLKPTGNTIFTSFGPFRIKSVSARKIVIDTDRLDYTIEPFSTTGNTHSFVYEIKTLPRTLAKIELYGETEIEDERFRIALNNLGIQIGYDEEHIFMESDINEHGYDYTLLNAKRKEMLSMYPEIYNYIGSYKAVINSINFFGWNDLEFNEYYKNVNVESPLYQKLHRVQIPDIFDNTVEGWTQNDWVEGKYQTGNWKKTNLFNLSYRITDEEGNNVLLYSLEEVQIKLNKLKRWLKRNTLPLSTNLVDITGIAEVENNNYQQYDVSNLSIKSHSENDTTVINFNYTETLNFDTNYLFQVNFYTLNGSSPSGWTGKIKTFMKATDGTGKLIPQKYYKILKNDLTPFSFNIDLNIDEYVYIETEYFNENGVGHKYNKMINSSTTKNYLLVNNNFQIPKNYTDRYINQGKSMNGIYYFDENGYLYLDD